MIPAVAGAPAIHSRSPMLRISLRPVDSSNWRALIDLPLPPEQQRFLHTNLFSLAEALIKPDAESYVPLAIYAGEELVGFLMYAHGPTVGKQYWLSRFMIGEPFQGKGYGREGMGALIELLSGKDDCETIHLTCDPENAVAINLYKRFGFGATGRRFGDGQDEWVLVVNPLGPNLDAAASSQAATETVALLAERGVLNSKRRDF